MSTKKINRKRKPPAFGALPGYDIEPLLEALNTRDELAAIDELMFLFEEGHPNQFLASCLIEAGIPSPQEEVDAVLPVSLPALAISLQMVRELPFEDAVLPLLQTASLQLSEQSEVEIETVDFDPEDPVHEESVTTEEIRALLIASLSGTQEDRDATLSRFLHWWQNGFDWKSLQSSLREVAERTNDPIGYFYFNSVQTIIAACGREWVPSVMEPLLTSLAHCSRNALGATGEPITQELLHESAFQLAEKLVTVEDETLWNEFTTHTMRIEGALLAAEQDVVFTTDFLNTMASGFKLMPSTKPLPELLEKDELILSDLPILIEFGKSNAALKFVRTWLAAGGEAEPIWGILLRCAARVDSIPQHGAALLCVFIWARWYRTMIGEQRSIFPLAATALLGLAPRSYTTASRYREDEENS